MVSIITNCYNGEAYLDETIKSVLNQTYTDWEYLLFDNCSTDKSAEIFKSYNDTRFKYYRHDHTVPLGHGRYEAVKLIHGDFVCFIDSDDLWLPQNLEKQVAIMESDSSIGIVYTDYQPFGVNNKIRETSKHGYRTMREMLEFYDLGLSSTMFRRELLQKYNISINKSYQIIADFDLFIRLSRVSKCYHIKENLVKYRTHTKNLSSTYTKTRLEYKDILNRFNDLFSENEKIECKIGLNKYSDEYEIMTFEDNLKKHSYIEAFKGILRLKRYHSYLSCIKRFFLHITMKL